MKIIFSDKYALSYDKKTIQQVRNESLENISFTDISSNIISIDNLDYIFYYLNSSGKTKGGNSIILKLFRVDSFKENEYEKNQPDRILKILRFPNQRLIRQQSIQNRFLKEIEALKECNTDNLQSIVRIYESGTCSIVTKRDKSRKDFLFYTMEFAESDLTKYLKEKDDFSFAEKISLCLNIAKGLNELFLKGYYHRDLKPDNILIVEGNLKISDLGLIDDIENNFKIDRKNELIGPKGWLSPEAMNKWLIEDEDTYSHDCKIDHQSDVFQLGKVFCYILQSNNPMGILRQRDFKIENLVVRREIARMLYYSKSKRTRNIQAFINVIKPIEKQLLNDA